MIFFFYLCELTFKSCVTKTANHPQDSLWEPHKCLLSVCMCCKSRCLWFLVGLRMLKSGNNRAERGEKTSDTRRVLSFKSVTQADGATWEISFGWRLHGLDPICCAPSGPTALTTNPNPAVYTEGIGRHMRGQCGLLTEVFHLKCQNNFPLTCWKSVLEVLLCHLTHNAVPDMRHRWTRSNLRGWLRLARTCSGPHILQTTSKKGHNTLVSWTTETIPVCITYFLESLKSQQLTLFPSMCPCSNREFGRMLQGCWGSGICSTGHQSMRDHM